MLRTYLNSIFLTSILLVCVVLTAHANNTSIDHRQSSTTTFTYEFHDPDGIQRIIAYYGPLHLYPIKKIIFLDPNCPKSVSLTINRFIIQNQETLTLSQLYILDCTGMGTDEAAYSMTFWEVNEDGSVEHSGEATHTEESIEFLDDLAEIIEEHDQWLMIEQMFELLNFVKWLIIVALILLMIILFKWFALGPFRKPRDPNVQDF